MAPTTVAGDLHQVRSLWAADEGLVISPLIAARTAPRAAVALLVVASGDIAHQTARAFGVVGWTAQPSPRGKLDAMADISITPLEPGRFDVRTTSTRHEVTVPGWMGDDPQLGNVDQQTIVRESMEFLLEREPATSIMSEFSLDVIPRYFREYDTEIRRRLR
jgi:hypothetical protein